MDPLTNGSDVPNMSNMSGSISAFAGTGSRGTVGIGGIGAHQDQTPGGSAVNSHIGGTGPVSITTSGKKWFVVYDLNSNVELYRLAMIPGDVFIFSWIADRLYRHAIEKDTLMRNALIYRCAEKNTLFFKESYKFAPAQFFGCLFCRKHSRVGLQADHDGRVVCAKCSTRSQGSRGRGRTRLKKTKS